MILLSGRSFCQWIKKKRNFAIYLFIFSFLFSYQGGGMKIVDRRYGQPVYPSSPSTKHIVLLPENFLLSETGQPIGRRDFLSVLVNVTSVMVRASYSTEASAVYRFAPITCYRDTRLWFSSSNLKLFFFTVNTVLYSNKHINQMFGLNENSQRPQTWNLQVVRSHGLWMFLLYVS